MNKKVGIAITVFAALMLFCCLGFVFTLKSATAKITEVITRDQTFVATVLKATAKDWDEGEFSKYADSSFNSPARREETKKLFASLKKNLGVLVSLGEVTPGSKVLGSNNGASNGLFISLTAKAKFEKGDGIFTVVVKNVKEKMTVTAISLDPDKSSVNAGQASNNP